MTTAPEPAVVPRDSMFEHVAQALDPIAFACSIDSDGIRFRRRRARELAWAALNALRRPTPQMVEAMWACTLRNSRRYDPANPFESPFTAAVDQVLSSQPDATPGAPTR